MRLHFLGGVDTVTGSQLLIEHDGRSILRDCGLFQGRRRQAEELNRNFLFGPTTITTCVLSHAHIDHCGNLPSLARSGYQGPIHATAATRELCTIMLHDAAHIQEQDAAYLNQKTSRRGQPPVEPLYTVADAKAAVALFQGWRYGETIEPVPGIELTFREAGHILGAALTEFALPQGNSRLRLGVAVDLGRKGLPLIRDPEILGGVDVLVMESTYGDRLHDPVADAQEELRAVVDRTWRRGGKILIPSFALERAQEILYHLNALVTAGRLPEIPVFVDSPMATAVTRVFEKCSTYLDEDYRKLHEQAGRVMSPSWVHFTSSVEESKAVTASKDPCIVISASGMCEHGRILHHLKHAVEDERNSIVIVGFQAHNTLGRRIVERQPEIRIFGDTFRLKAEVTVLNAFSAHADRDELIAYAKAVQPRKIFLVHGEETQRQALAEHLRAAQKAPVFTPARGDIVEL